MPDRCPTWTVTSEPELRLGAVDGEDPHTFGSVEGIVQRSDGVIVVADGQAQELRAFDPDGAHLWTAGGPGEGPGEFMSLMNMSGEALATATNDRLGNVGALVDAVDRVWVQDWVPHYENRHPRWWVVGPDGSLVAEAAFHREFVPFHIGHDHVLGRVLHDLNVPFVERRRILRPER